MKSKLLIVVLCLISISCRKENFENISDHTAHLTVSAKNLVTNNIVPDSSKFDKNFKFFGRWNFADSTQCNSFWGGAYFKVNFKGHNVALLVDSTAITNYYVKIDGGKWTSYIGKSGKINLTPIPLTDTLHTLSVAQGKDYNYIFKFRGLVLDSAATTLEPKVSNDLIEYIGDSITSGYMNPQADVSDYAWICAEALGAEHTQIAYPGICLVNGHPGAGMVTEYLKLQSPAFPLSLPWDFTKYRPTMVVCNLGVNDNNKKVTDAAFKSAYITLLKSIRASFPLTEIFAMRTFTGVKASATLAAVNSRINDHDRLVHYVNTTGWLVKTDYYDGIHPTQNGHLKAGNLLKKLLVPYMNRFH